MNRYKIIVSNNRIYKEYTLPEDMDNILLGTSKECSLRIRKDLFFEEIELKFEYSDNEWTISCEDNLFISTDGLLKNVSKILHHGDKLLIKYQMSNLEVFEISFMYDFDFDKKDFSRTIDITNIDNIMIGCNQKCDLIIEDSLLQEGYVSIAKNNGQYYVSDEGTRFGVYVNNIKISNKTIIKDFDFISIVSYSFYFKGGWLFVDINKTLKIKDLPYEDRLESKSHLVYPDFSRNVRIQYIIPEEIIEVKQPQPKPQKQKKNIIISLIPSLSMIALTVVLRGIMGGGGSFVIYSACSMSIGIIMSIVSFVSEGGRYKKDVEKREEEYLEYIEEKECKIQVLRENELRIRKVIHESLDNSIEETKIFGKRIFERGIGDKDFLQVYLGNGAVIASSEIRFSAPEFVDREDKISLLSEQLEVKYHFINDVPIISNFAQSNGVGIVGKRNKLYEILKNITLDLSIRHYYKEVKFFYVFNEENLEKVKWLRWLKHIDNESLNIRNMICDEESKNVLLEYLYSVLSDRESRLNDKENDLIPQFVVFVFDANIIEKHPISKYFEKANDFGFTFVFFHEYEENIPKGCTELIKLDVLNEEGTILQTINGEEKQVFKYNLISDNIAEKITLKLAAINIAEVNLESELTKNITLFELLNVISPDDLDLMTRWDNSKVYKSMAAPLGVKRKNEIVNLDIGDKANAHGPHGLVAGTTGSGKSEIIQTYVLTMASLFHPYDVSFVIIDFKGGGMANQFKDLPHLMGTITNIDGREINRSLLSIKSELLRRQEMFSMSGVNHINDYIQLYKKGEVSEPIPHLIMIVDEFAELKSEYPDFMKEIISAARIGRTLGVHLILATQKPSGVVDNQIWSNSKFKLCLKVQTKEDSNEVIKSPLAAEIKEPGRAYFQVGNNEIFELFQSAYSGAKISKGTDNIKTYSIYEVNLWGKRKLVYTNKKSEDNDGELNQLEAMVQYIGEYCENQDIKKLKSICLPPLKDIIFVSELLNAKMDIANGVLVSIGVYDDPEQQVQTNYKINLSENNTYIIGSAQSGKTTLLQTIIFNIMKYYTPNEVNLYVVDCGNMSLKIFEDAKHVGGVVLPSEEEKVQNLFKVLHGIVQQRKDAFLFRGLSTYKTYVEAGYCDFPQIILVIDNISSFREQFSKYEDVLLNLSREGQSVGINIIITGSQTNSLGMKMLANYGTRIALHCNEKSEYSNLLERCKMEPKEIPGRGICVVNKKNLEFQVALAFEGDKEIDRVDNMKKFIDENSLLFDDCKAKAIPVVPEIIYEEKLMKDNKELYTKPYLIPFGVDYATVEYRFIDLLNTPLLGVSGREQGGKTNFVEIILNSIRKNVFGNLTEVYIIDEDDRKLEKYSEFGFVKEYSTLPSSIEFFVEEINNKLLERQEVVTSPSNQKGLNILHNIPLLLLVIENKNVLAELSKNKAIQDKLIAMIKQLKKYRVMILFSNLENIPISYNSIELLKVIKENKRSLIFDDMENIKLADVTPKLIKEFNKSISVGDGYEFCNGNVFKIKTILAD